MDATGISIGMEDWAGEVLRQAEKLRDDMRREHGRRGFVSCGVMAHSTGSPASFGASFFASRDFDFSVSGHTCALDALDALRDAIAEKIASRPSLTELAATLGSEVPE